MAKEIKVELDVPYGKTADEAKGFRVIIREGNYPNALSIETRIDMGEAMNIMKNLAAGVQDYREAMNKKFGSTVEDTVKEMERVFE